MRLNDNDILFRFLLRPSRWIEDNYIDDPVHAINEAIKDLDIDSDNISVFLINNIIIENGISDLELISFLFSAAFRKDLNKLCYIDITFKEIINLGLLVRKNPITKKITHKFYSDKHYEIYYLDDKKRRELAKFIFSIIKLKYSGELPNISKQRIKELIPNIYDDPRIEGLDNKYFYSWAIPNNI